MSIPIPLAALDPHTCGRADPVGWTEDVPWADADGMRFSCPKCWLENGGSDIGVHSVIIWQPHVPQTVTPIPGRWSMDGSSFDDVTLVAGSSSVQINGGCNAHFHIKVGHVVDLT